MLLIDPPRWPAHDTRFGHLVSDSSLAELHAFARKVALPAGAFDHDHYDVPERHYPAILASGAELTPTRQLLDSLASAGLRIRPRDRQPGRQRAVKLLHRQWSAAPLAPETVRDNLLTRWQEPHRRYHDVRHLHQTITAADSLGPHDPLVSLALWFHDAVYEGEAGNDEEASAVLAGELLTEHLPASEVAEVQRLVRLTATHDPESGDLRGARVIDADLSILAVSEARYHVYARDVRRDYADVPEDTFVTGRTMVVQGLLDHPQLYSTDTALRTWEESARRNLTAELNQLATGLPLVPGGTPVEAQAGVMPPGSGVAD
ncbi:MAG: DUF4031 domain-containing protein [Propioniciclava sp.]